MHDIRNHQHRAGAKNWHAVHAVHMGGVYLPHMKKARVPEPSAARGSEG